MSHPYRISPPVSDPPQGLTLRHRLRRIIQRFRLRVGGTFLQRHPWACPECGLRGFTKLEKRSVVQFHDTEKDEWLVFHRCCDVVRSPRPLLPTDMPKQPLSFTTLKTLMPGVAPPSDGRRRNGPFVWN